MLPDSRTGFGRWKGEGGAGREVAGEGGGSGLFADGLMIGARKGGVYQRERSGRVGSVIEGG
jgi:hypothetical protein